VVALASRLAGDAEVSQLAEELETLFCDAKMTQIGKLPIFPEKIVQAPRWQPLT
jgi:hypothetical protein